MTPARYVTSKPFRVRVNHDDTINPLLNATVNAIAAISEFVVVDFHNFPHCAANAFAIPAYVKALSFPRVGDGPMK